MDFDIDTDIEEESSDDGMGKKSSKMVNLKKKTSTINNKCTARPNSRPIEGEKKYAKAKSDRAIGAEGPKSSRLTGAGVPKFCGPIGAKTNSNNPKNTT
ncbi:hypothetical protein AHAS_Ahas04G0181400 [Arachis hypogaea]